MQKLEDFQSEHTRPSSSNEVRVPELSGDGPAQGPAADGLSKTASIQRHPAVTGLHSRFLQESPSGCTALADLSMAAAQENYELGTNPAQEPDAVSPKSSGPPKDAASAAGHAVKEEKTQASPSATSSRVTVCRSRKGEEWVNRAEKDYFPYFYYDGQPGASSTHRSVRETPSSSDHSDPRSDSSAYDTRTIEAGATTLLSKEEEEEEEGGAEENEAQEEQAYSDPSTTPLTPAPPPSASSSSSSSSNQTTASSNNTPPPAAALPAQLQPHPGPAAPSPISSINPLPDRGSSVSPAAADGHGIRKWMLLLRKLAADGLSVSDVSVRRMDAWLATPWGEAEAFWETKLRWQVRGERRRRRRRRKKKKRRMRLRKGEEEREVAAVAEGSGLRLEERVRLERERTLERLTGGAEGGRGVGSWARHAKLEEKGRVGGVMLEELGRRNVGGCGGGRTVVDLEGGMQNESKVGTVFKSVLIVLVLLGIVTGAVCGKMA
ncbi:hypothetical protein B0J12DRAFT_693357 [Macrophomina phaseolina]|uniref:Uncharacterized protein n=1 Tax=Macrophomina phaseolina TaxID=35725 RepID=A0ABQ8GX72_9PEZI|nr:hypothetical protein B0J12DRAFT_693357 [Macrophomina phaseolina]